MERNKLLEFVSDKKIRFTTARPAHAKFVFLDREIIVTGPPEVVSLRRTGDVLFLRELVNLLAERGRAWAAEVVLAAMTGREADIVNAFAADRNAWLNSVGRTAHERWSNWLDETNGKLVWDSVKEVFIIAE
jgi:hypothetical protein